MKTSVIVNWQFTGLHFWPAAVSTQTEFLKYPHRHRFFVTVEMGVGGGDREIEFFHVKEYLEKCVKDTLGRASMELDVDVELDTLSCETVAQIICNAMMDWQGEDVPITVTVMEDDENGARAVHNPTSASK